MQILHDRLREIYLEACDIPPGTQRSAYLAEACAGDTALREHVEAMLKLAPQAGDFFKPFESQHDPRTTRVVLPPCKVLAEGPGTMIGRYKLLEQIGEGGFGVVYMAEQVEPVYRRVALKIIKLGMDTHEVIARFDAERQALALMDHPSVATVLDAGATDSGRPYFVMELVRGMPITEYCDTHRLSTRERIDLFIGVCRAVQHAHSKGIIHRDLKPSNILVIAQDGHPVPKIIDFGIAKAIQQPLTQKTLFTRFGQMIGTPVYMSPEHAIGEDVDTRSDVYSLGVVLYELLTGKQPFDIQKLREVGHMEMLRVIKEVEPVRPSTRLTRLGQELAKVAELRHSNARRLSELVRGDLDWITMKALQKDRTRRYDTPVAIAEDLQRHLNDQPVTAGPPSPAYRAWKFTLRHRYAVAAATGIFISLVIGLAFATFGFLRAREERSRAIRAEALTQQQWRVAVKEAEKARAKEMRARQISYASDMGLASQALEQSNLGRALSLLQRHAGTGATNDLRGWEWRYLWQQCKSGELFHLGNLSNSVLSVAASSDGMLAVAADLSGNLGIWDLLGHRLLAEVPAAMAPVALSPDGKVLVSADRALREPQTGREVGRLDDENGGLKKIAFSPDGRWFAALSSMSDLSIWDCATWKRVGLYGGFPCTGIHIGGLAFSHTGDLLAVGTQDGRLHIVETRTGRVLHSWQAHRDAVTSLAFAPDSSQIASGAGFTEHKIKLWNPDGSLQGELEGHRAWICSLAFSADGSTLASSSADQNIGLWNPRTRESLGMLKGHLQEVWSVVFLPDGKTLLSSSKDGAVKVWRMPPMAHEKNEPLPEQLAFAADGREVVGIAPGGFVARWALPSFRMLGEITALGTDNMQIAASRSGGLVAVVSKQGEIKVWDPQMELLITNFVVGTASRPVTWLGFANDGRKLVAVIDATAPQVFDTTTWQRVASWKATGEKHLHPVCLSPDGELLATAGDATVVYSLSNGVPVARIAAHKYYTDSIAFSPDGKWLATGSMDGTAKLWRAGTWELTGTFTGHLLGVHSVAFSIDSRRFATSSLTKEAVKLWDLTTMQEVLNLSMPGGVTHSLAFSPDGEILVCFSTGFGPRCWSAPPLTGLDVAPEWDDP
jgi:WD40 repeat protein/serine/threonine protein kinase